MFRSLFLMNASSRAQPRLGRIGPNLRLVLALALLMALAAAVPSRAATLTTGTSAQGTRFPGIPLDGPSPDIRSLGGVAVAREGGGAIVYVRRDGGIDHIFASLLLPTGWAPPRRVDVGLPGPSTEPVVAAGNLGRVAVAFINGGSLWGAVVPAVGQGFSAPQAIAGSAASPALGMAPDGAAYLSYTDPRAPSQVDVAHLDRKAVTFAALGQSLNIDPAHVAGDTPAKRSHVAVSSDGTAVVTWGETGTGGRVHEWARRVSRLTVGSGPQDLSLDGFDSRPGGSAESAQVGLQDNGSLGFAVFRQGFTDGAAMPGRAFARRLIGSLYDAPTPIDALAFPTADGAGAPRLAFTGAGDAIATVGLTASHQTMASIDTHDQNAFSPPIRLATSNDAIDPQPVPALGDKGLGLVAWAQSPGGAAPVSILASTVEDFRFGPEVPLSLPVFGSVDASAGLDAAADRLGDVIVGFVQADGANRRIMVGGQNPGPNPSGVIFLKSARPPLSWPAAPASAGAVTYQVILDGAPIGASPTTQLTPTASIPDGIHSLQVLAVDGAGHQTPVLTTVLGIDTTPPKATLSVTGIHRGGSVTMSVHAYDRPPHSATGIKSASGVGQVKVSFGDGKSVSETGTVNHRYSHRGKFTIRVTAVDRAGNRRTARHKVKVP